MATLALTLAGLVAGHNGSEVETVPGVVVAFSPRDGAWKGIACLGLNETCEARYARGRLSLRWPAERKGVTSPFVLTLEEESRARVRISGRPFPALVKWDGRRLLICYGGAQRPRSFAPSRDTVLLTLEPAAPGER